MNSELPLKQATAGLRLSRRQLAKRVSHTIYTKVLHVLMFNESFREVEPSTSVRVT